MSVREPSFPELDFVFVSHTIYPAELQPDKLEYIKTWQFLNFLE